MLRLNVPRLCLLTLACSAQLAWGAPIETIAIDDGSGSAAASGSTAGNSLQALHVAERLRATEKAIAQLQGELDRVRHQLQENIKQQDELAKQFKQAVAQLDGVAKKKAAEHDSLTGQYRQALTAIQAKDYTKAHKTLVSITKQHPKTEVAGNAYYWLGELAWMDKKSWVARGDYREVVTHYPGSPKEAAALYKLVKVDLKLNKKKQANEWYAMLKKKYPKSPLTTEAKKLLG